MPPCADRSAIQRDALPAQAGGDFRPSALVRATAAQGGSDSQVSVCIIDANSSDRAKLQRAIHCDPKFVCLGEFGDAKTALPAIERLKPRVKNAFFRSAATVR